MKLRSIVLATLVLATPVMAQSGAGMASTNKAAKIQLKVDSGLAATAAKISADSAYALAKGSTNGREVSSAELRMANGKMVYEVKVLNDKKKSSIAYIDAMNGAVLDAQTYGGLK